MTVRGVLCAIVVLLLVACTRDVGGPSAVSAQTWSLIDGFENDPLWTQDASGDHAEMACEPVRPARVAAIALNTIGIADDAGARAAIAAAADETGLVVDDPVRFGSDRLLDAVLAAFAR